MIKLEERKQHKSNQLQAYNKEQEKKKKQTVFMKNYYQAQKNFTDPNIGAFTRTSKLEDDRKPPNHFTC